MPTHYHFSSKVIVYAGASTWRFLGLPHEEAKEIKETHGKHSKAWGSVQVTATIGTTTWQTSLFPDTKSGTYLLPLKAAVRKKEGVADGATVSCCIALL